jgi:hypothetical protein
MLEDPSIPLVTHQASRDEDPDVRWWLFAQNSTGSGGCRHAQILLGNDEVPTLCCRSCGKRWTFVPAGKRPLYCSEDDPKYPGMLDNQGWSESTRVRMVDKHDRAGVLTQVIPLGNP